MLLVIDNFDSFTYNIVQYYAQLGTEQKVFRNKAISAQEALALDPDHILISPGPGGPQYAGVSLEIIATFAGKKPILGICLGHQCLAHHFGGKVVHAERLLHGKTSPILHNGDELFSGLPDGFSATRYHSLIVESATLPECLEITARTSEQEIMGLRHKTEPLWGVQFHPESIATKNGIKILKNFLRAKPIPRPISAPKPITKKTLFEKIINREISATIEHEDAHSIVIRDIAPQAPTHLLIIPKKPINRLSSAKAQDQALLGHLLLTAQQMARKLHLSKGFRIVINNGREAGETVPHIHVHLLAGRTMEWPPG